MTPAVTEQHLKRRLRELFLATDENRGQITVFAAIPDAVLDVWADIYWTADRLYSLTSPVHRIAVADVAWTLDIPFWRDDDRLFSVTAREVIAAPNRFPRHHANIMRADLSYPIALFRYRGRCVVVDGYHRIARATMLGVTTLPARTVAEDDLPRILIQDGFLGELNRLRTSTPHLPTLLRTVARELRDLP